MVERKEEMSSCVAAFRKSRHVSRPGGSREGRERRKKKKNTMGEKVGERSEWKMSEVQKSDMLRTGGRIIVAEQHKRTTCINTRLEGKNQGSLSHD